MAPWAKRRQGLVGKRFEGQCTDIVGDVFLFTDVPYGLRLGQRLHGTL